MRWLPVQVTQGRGGFSGFGGRRAPGRPPYTGATVTVYNAMPMGNDITVTGTFRTRRDFGAGYK